MPVLVELDEDFEDALLAILELLDLLLDEITTELDELDLVLDDDEVATELDETPQALTTP